MASPLRKQPQQSRSRALVASILEAAGDLLGKKSEDPLDIPLQRIAERAGVGIGSLYDYFANREGVWSSFLAWVTERNFTTLAEKAGADGRDFVETVPALVEETLDLYLNSPSQTRGIIAAIVRFEWVKPVVQERDRFAHLLAAKLAVSRPHVPRERLELLSELLCDAAIGVVMGELWRDRDASKRVAYRKALTDLVVRELRALDVEFPRR